MSLNKSKGIEKVQSSTATPGEITLPYEYLVKKDRTDNDDKEFREQLKKLSDAQLYILKQVALEEKCNTAVELIEEERPGELGEALEDLTLEQKYELAKSTIMPEGICAEWFDEVYKDMIEVNKVGDEGLRISKFHEKLSMYSEEKLKTLAIMLEKYMKDKDTAELLMKEYNRRQELAQSLKKRRQQSKIEQVEKADGLKDRLFDDKKILDMNEMIALSSITSADKEYLADKINLREFKEKEYIIKCLTGGFEGGEKENIRRIQFLLIGDKDGYKKGGKGHILWPLSKYGTDGTMGEETWDSLVAYITDPDNQYLDLSKVVAEGISVDLKNQINSKQFKDKEYIIKCLSGGFEGGEKENIRRLQFLLIGDKDGYKKGEEGHKIGLLSKCGTDGFMGKETLQALAQYVIDPKNQYLALDDVVLPRISSLNLRWLVETINEREFEDKEYVVKCLSGGVEGGVKENVRRLQFLLIGDKDGYKKGEKGHILWPLSKYGTDGFMGKETWNALAYYVNDLLDKSYSKNLFLGRSLDEYERRLSDLSYMMPYEYVYHKEYKENRRTEESKEDFRREIKNLTDAQLYILKKCAIDYENYEVVRIIEEERPGDLGKAVENLTLRQKYELALTTEMPEAYCPEWFDSVYKSLLQIEKIPDEASRIAEKKRIKGQYSDEENHAFASMIEDFMRDKETAELLRN